MVTLSLTKDECWSIYRIINDARTKVISNNHPDAILLDRVRSKLSEELNKNGYNTQSAKFFSVF